MSLLRPGPSGSSPPVVGAPELAQGAAELADVQRARSASRRGGQQVAGAGRRLAHEGEGARGRLGVALGADARGALALALLAGGVDAVELDAVVGFLRELVDADDDAIAGLDGGLEPVGGFLDLALDEAGLDRGDGAAELVDALDQLARPVARARR